MDMNNEKSENKPVSKPSEKPVKKKAGLSKEAKKTLKGLIFPIIVLVIILGVIFLIVNTKEANNSDQIIKVHSFDESNNKEIVLENGDLKLTMDPLTTQFALEVKSSGKIWRSNPENAASDTIATGDKKGELSSLILLTYREDTGKETPFNAYTHCVDKALYEIESTKDYIKVAYSIGNVDKEFIIPTVMLAADFDKWLANMEKADQSLVKNYYKKYDPKKPGKKDDIDGLKERFADYANGEVVYVLREDSENKIKKVKKQEMETAFAKAGYTNDDFKADKERDALEKDGGEDQAVYNINVYYKLEGKDLVVEIPFNEIEYPKGEPPYKITPLPYFGAAGTVEDGFMFVPEGGGAIIKYNNGKQAQNGYYSNVYGWDMALSRKDLVHNTMVSFNTFGMSDSTNSFMCFLEDGVSYASIQADISGHYNTFNYANAQYRVGLGEKYDISNMSITDVYVFMPSLPDEMISQRYRFIDSGDIADMAKTYKDYYVGSNKDLFTLNSETSAPVVVEVVTAIDKMKQVLGVPVSRPLKLTTYKEAGEMVSQLKADGLDNMSVKLTGWMNGGVNQKILKKSKTVSACGSKGDLKKMAQTINNLGVDLYMDGVTQYAYDSNLFDGFNSYADAARLITKERAELHKYSTVTYSAREGTDPYYLLHADLATQMAKNLSKTAKKYNANVSFRELGEDLSADYYRKKVVTREQARKDQTQLLADLQGQTKIMINTGNDYAVLHSDLITNMDLRGSEYAIIDEYYPMFQMAIHGYRDYTGESVNTSADPQMEVLYAAEYGAGLSFTIIKESPFALQKTLYTEYFGASYDTWHDKIVDIYQRYNRELGHVFKQEMTGHVTFEKGVTCTTYADGTKVYVNYNQTEKSADGRTIPAKDYLVVR